MRLHQILIRLPFNISSIFPNSMKITIFIFYFFRYGRMKLNMKMCRVRKFQKKNLWKTYKNDWAKLKSKANFILFFCPSSSCIFLSYNYKRFYHFFLFFSFLYIDIDKIGFNDNLTFTKGVVLFVFYCLKDKNRRLITNKKKSGRTIFVFQLKRFKKIKPPTLGIHYYCWEYSR